ncbi:MAG: TetR/AcrR family transcriptional regulator [Chlorobi bacterium]|nr:TetR/AcrR family transcriptional regulator [Chlorobiota bacterium]
MVKTLQTEDRILITAREVFIAEGYDGARMQHIADKAGINKSLLHYYYRTKENLFTAVFERVFNEIMSRIFSLVESEESLENLIRIFFREHIGFLLEQPRLPAFFISESSLHPGLLSSVFKKFGTRGIKKFSDLVDMEKKAGKIDDNLDPRQLLINILSLSIFPIAIRPIFKDVFSLSDAETEDLLRRRMELLPVMVLASLYNK